MPILNAYIIIDSQKSMIIVHSTDFLSLTKNDTFLEVLATKKLKTHY